MSYLSCGFYSNLDYTTLPGHISIFKGILNAQRSD